MTAVNGYKKILLSPKNSRANYEQSQTNEKFKYKFKFYSTLAWAAKIALGESCNERKECMEACGEVKTKHRSAVCVRRIYDV